MSGSDPSGPVPENAPPPQASQWAGLPWVWAVPIVALLIAGWLGYRALIERGPTITISFQTAEGIEADRTTVRYKDVDLGQVAKVGLSADHSRAIVTARMSREAEPLLRADTTFWVVRPRFGLSGISGLSTVFRAPISACCREGAGRRRHFTGVETPPPKEGLVSGQAYTLIADRLAEVSDGSPVYFHGVQVGEVISHELSDRDGRVALHIFIYAPHPALIHAESRFWVASGLDVSIGSQGVKDRDRAADDDFKRRHRLRHARQRIARQAQPAGLPVFPLRRPEGRRRSRRAGSRLLSPAVLRARCAASMSAPRSSCADSRSARSTPSGSNTTQRATRSRCR